MSNVLWVAFHPRWYLFRAPSWLVSLVLFVASLPLPAISGRDRALHGFDLLLVGWLGVIFDSHVAWFANPFIAATWLAMVLGLDLCATAFGACAVLLAATAAVTVPAFSVIQDEGGTGSRIPTSRSGTSCGSAQC